MAMVTYFSLGGLSVTIVMCTAHATSTDSKCITYNNAYTSKHIGINVHERHYFASASAFNNHSLNPAKRLFCGGTQQSVCTLAHSTWS